MANGENKKVEKVVEMKDNASRVEKKVEELKDTPMFAYEPAEIQRAANIMDTIEIKSGIMNAKKLIQIMDILENGKQITMKQ